MIKKVEMLITSLMIVVFIGLLSFNVYAADIVWSGNWIYGNTSDDDISDTLKLSDGSILLAGYYGKWQIIDKNGNNIINGILNHGISSTQIKELSNGNILFAGTDGKWEIIDKSGNNLEYGTWIYGTQTIHDAIELSSGNIFLSGKTGDWQIIDGNGNNVLNGIWSHTGTVTMRISDTQRIVEFNNGNILLTRQDGEWKIIDSAGNDVATGVWKHGDFYDIYNTLKISNGNVFLRGSYGKWSIIDSAGNTLAKGDSSIQYVNTEVELNDGKIFMAGYGPDKQWETINSSGIYINKGILDYNYNASDMKSEVIDNIIIALVWPDGIWELVDINGNHIDKGIWDQGDSYIANLEVLDSNSFLIAGENGKICIINFGRPLITLNGESELFVPIGSTYTEEGATATDHKDGDISGSIVIGGDIVNTKVEGDYILTYNVTDSEGNTADEVIRTVHAGNYKTIEIQDIGTQKEGNTNYDMPYNAWYHDQRIQYVIYESELTSNGMSIGDEIIGIFLDCIEKPQQSLNDFTVRFKEDNSVTSLSSFINSGLTEAYRNNIPIPDNGWMYYKFDIPYTWNGQNLIVDITRDNDSYTRDGGNQIITGIDSNVRMIGGYSDSDTTYPHDLIDMQSTYTGKILNTKFAVKTDTLPDIIINFPDANLKQALIDIGIDTSGDGEIQVSEAEAVSERLDLSNKGIFDITGLEYFTNIDELILYSNQISDIDALQDLTNLNTLSLLRNQISDISALRNLTSLLFLSVGGNQISDINTLQSLTSLKELQLWDNQISNISALSALNNLEKVYLANNQISDISALGKLMNYNAGSLTRLDLGNCPLNNSSTPGVVHKLDLDFTVDGIDYEVWVVEKPIITLNGDTEIYIYEGNVYVDPGAIANDPQEGDISGRIVITGSVDTNIIGEYIIKYNVTDSEGYAANEVIRTVKVFNPITITLTPDSGDVIGGANIEIVGSSNVPVTKLFYRWDSEVTDVTHPTIQVDADTGNIIVPNILGVHVLYVNATDENGIQLSSAEIHNYNVTKIVLDNIKYLNNVKHNQILKILNNQDVININGTDKIQVSDPITPVKEEIANILTTQDLNIYNIFYNGNNLNYRVEFDTLEANSISDIEVIFDFNTNNEIDIEIELIEVDLYKVGDIVPIADNISIPEVSEWRKDKYHVYLGNNITDNATYVIDYKVKLIAEYNPLELSDIEIKNHVDLLIYDSNGQYAGIVNPYSTENKNYIETKVRR